MVRSTCFACQRNERTLCAEARPRRCCRTSVVPCNRSGIGMFIKTTEGLCCPLARIGLKATGKHVSTELASLLTQMGQNLVATWASIASLGVMLAWVGCSRSNYVMSHLNAAREQPKLRYPGRLLAAACMQSRPGWWQRNAEGGPDHPEAAAAGTTKRWRQALWILWGGHMPSSFAQCLIWIVYMRVSYMTEV